MGEEGLGSVFSQQGALEPRFRRGEQQACKPRPRRVRQAVGVEGNRRKSVFFIRFGGDWWERTSGQFLACRARWCHGDGVASSRPASPGHEASGKPEPSAGLGIDFSRQQWGC
jgi:hypothetical protein